VSRPSGPGASGVVLRPGLFARLGGPAQVAVISAPAGSGKTVLLRSWIDEAGLAERAGWVTVGRDERDARQFWLAVVGALRRTVPGSALLQPVTAAPDLDGGAIAERLLTDLASLREPIWLVLDDVHELRSEALPQLELLLMRARGSCGSCWPLGMTFGWVCIGCGWRASWPRFAQVICGSAWLRLMSCSMRPG